MSNSGSIIAWPDWIDERGEVRFDTPDGAGSAEHDIVIGADGAYSVVRERLTHIEGTDFSQTFLPWGYKELSIPARDGDFALDPGALHIWPRGSSMMIALPNLDRSFTATLFWPNEGPSGFARPGLGCRHHGPVPARLSRCARPDAGPARPVPRAPAWVAGHRPLLAVGPRPDGAHRRRGACHRAVLRAGDQLRLRGCRGAGSLSGRDRRRLVDRPPALRRTPSPKLDAIAELALDNFVEMRDRVASPVFRTQKRAEHALERRLPEHFVSLYELVSFSTVPYKDVRRQASHPRQAARAAGATAAAVSAGVIRRIRKDEPMTRRPDLRRRPPGDGGPAQLRRVPAP